MTLKNKAINRYTKHLQKEEERLLTRRRSGARTCKAHFRDLFEITQDNIIISIADIPEKFMCKLTVGNMEFVCTVDAYSNEVNIYLLPTYDMLPIKYQAINEADFNPFDYYSAAIESLLDLGRELVDFQPYGVMPGVTVL